MTTFVDPWNPSHAEVVAWAFDAESMEPTQDFDLALSWRRGLEKTYLDLANDGDCPKQAFFLHLIYLMVGDAVRANYKSVPRPSVEGFVELGDAYDHTGIRAWQKRARSLLKDPTTFSYEAWCAGGLARQDVGEPD